LTRRALSRKKGAVEVAGPAGSVSASAGKEVEFVWSQMRLKESSKSE